jgi:hypothetical protein
VPILCWPNGRVDDAKSAIITAITITREKASQEVITADIYRSLPNEESVLDGGSDLTPRRIDSYMDKQSPSTEPSHRSVSVSDATSSSSASLKEKGLFIESGSPFRTLIRTSPSTRSSHSSANISGSSHIINWPATECVRNDARSLFQTPEVQAAADPPRNDSTEDSKSSRASVYSGITTDSDSQPGRSFRKHAKMGVQKGEGRRLFPDELFAGFTPTKFLDDPEFPISFQPDVATGLSAHHSLAVATDGTFSVT